MSARHSDVPLSVPDRFERRRRAVSLFEPRFVRAEITRPGTGERSTQGPPGQQAL